MSFKFHNSLSSNGMTQSNDIRHNNYYRKMCWHQPFNLMGKVWIHLKLIFPLHILGKPLLKEFRQKLNWNSYTALKTLVLLNMPHHYLPEHKVCPVVYCALLLGLRPSPSEFHFGFILPLRPLPHGIFSDLLWDGCGWFLELHTSSPILLFCYSNMNLKNDICIFFSFFLQHQVFKRVLNGRERKKMMEISILMATILKSMGNLSIL